MIDNSKEYILCSAVKRKEAKSNTPYHLGKNDICSVELGYRHHDILQRNSKEVIHSQQGFYTSFGRYVDRKEAAQLAFECGQTKSQKGVLYSEDIY